MPETTPNSKGPAPAQYAATEPALIPADQLKPEDFGKLSIRYADGAPVIVVSGGTVIPGGITVVDESGNAVAGYAARASTSQFIFTGFSLGGTLSPTLALRNKN
ncbi:hypothetical protein ACGFY3_22505 [Streptomyces mirabilis]|uniref:hypothetical protein n=1 Tax=Streptomyces mirabilis TaxID=68239 RepID=UPI0037159091